MSANEPVLDLSFMQKGFKPENLLQHLVADCTAIADSLPPKERKKMQKFVKGFIDIQAGYGDLGLVVIGKMVNSSSSYVTAYHDLKKAYKIFSENFKKISGNENKSKADIVNAFIKDPKNKQVIQKFTDDGMPPISKGVWAIHDIYPILMESLELPPMSSEADRQLYLLYARYLSELEKNWHHLDQGIVGMVKKFLPEKYAKAIPKDVEIKKYLRGVVDSLTQKVSDYDKQWHLKLEAKKTKSEKHELSEEVIESIDEKLKDLKKKQKDNESRIAVLEDQIKTNNESKWQSYIWSVEEAKKEKKTLETETPAIKEKLRTLKGFKKIINLPTSQESSVAWLISLKSELQKLRDLHDNDCNAICDALVNDVIDKKIKGFQEKVSSILDLKNVTDTDEKQAMLLERLEKIVSAEKEIKLLQKEFGGFKMKEIKEELEKLKKAKNDISDQLIDLIKNKVDANNKDVDVLNEAKIIIGILKEAYLTGEKKETKETVKDKEKVKKVEYLTEEMSQELGKKFVSLANAIKHADIDLKLMRLTDPGIAKLYRTIGGANFIQARYRKKDIMFLQRLINGINENKDLSHEKRLRLMLGAIAAVKAQMKTSKTSVGVGKFHLMLDDIGNDIEAQLAHRFHQEGIVDQQDIAKSFSKIMTEFYQHLPSMHQKISKFSLNEKIKKAKPIEYKPLHFMPKKKKLSEKPVVEKKETSRPKSEKK